MSCSRTDPDLNAPSPDTIPRATAAIRKHWSLKTRLSRSGEVAHPITVTEMPSLPTRHQTMFSSLRVAIADDDCRMCELLQQMVRKLGNEVVTVAENGNLLIQQCAIAQPDVVITGDLMPDMCGADIAAVIYNSRPIPIILFSGYCDRDRVLYAEQRHIFMYLVKPIIQEHLEAALAGCRRQGFNGPSGTNADSVLVGAYSESFGSAPYHDHTHPPDRQVSRQSHSGQSFIPGCNNRSRNQPSLSAAGSTANVRR